jgi:spore germination protein
MIKLNEEIESYLNHHTQKLLKKLQRMEVDPLQVGTRTLHPFAKPMSDKEWLHDWSTMEIKTECKLELEPL